MKSKRLGRYGLVAAVLIVGLAVGYGAGKLHEQSPAETPHAAEAGASEDSATVWTCSMHPQIRQPNPGKCPICAMDLIPLTDDDSSKSSGPREFRTSPEAAALMDIATAPVERRFAEAEVRMVGEVTYDETRLAYITAWVPGRIERMYADFTGTLVREGDHMVDLYSPDLLAAKDELQRAKRALKQIPAGAPEVLRRTAESTADAVRSKLRRWGMTPAQIARAEESGPESDRITIYAPTGGTVIERNGQEGMYVDTGERIYAIASLDRLWVQLEAYESDLAWLHFGQTVSFTTEALPGEVFEGTIAFIDPTVDRMTRTVDIRVNVSNEDGRLKPGMFARATVKAKVAGGGRVMDSKLAGKWISPMHPEIVKDGPGTCDICGMALVPAEDLGYVGVEDADNAKPLVIPASAPLITGTRAVVYVETPASERPTFEGRVITLGPRAGDSYIVRAGLEEGERVVVNGAFKIDSALQIQAKPSMMSMPGGSLLGTPEHEVLRAHIRTLAGAYLPLHEALAQDDYEAARAALRAITGAAELVTGETRVPALQEAINELTASEDIAQLREAFRELSNALIALIQEHGIAAGPAVYLMHCPMAFNSAGADWVQPDEEVRNPYFGAAMFSCGTVKEILAEPAAMSPSAGASHNHAEGSSHE